MFLESLNAPARYDSSVGVYAREKRFLVTDTLTSTADFSLDEPSATLPRRRSKAKIDTL